MHGPSEVLRLFRTVRYLRPAQVIGRARFRLSRPAPDARPAPAPRKPTGRWVRPAERRASLSGPSSFLLLNQERSLESHGWDDPSVDKLWRYNQHYFDDLCADGAESRSSWHSGLMERWVRENPAASGTGWEPYPTSLRLVNWVKWSLGGNALPPACLQSMAVQARWLTHRLEWHLLGNHLFANAKALLFAGCAFEGPEAERWLAIGSEILRTQVPEQVLPDGGQFERSPMYHALAVEDVLDLANLAGAFPRAGESWMPLVGHRICGMRHWLATMCHPDGEVSFFNDCAFGVHPAPSRLERYARDLGLGPAVPPADGITLLADSGYVRLQSARAVALLDVGPVGPDYLPGHAHADTLSFELSVDGRRVLVNSGTSRYGVGPERSRQRGTPAHNAVDIDGQDSSEVWGGFRVARRARPVGLSVQPGAGLRVSCAHDGYRRLAGKPMHRRTWEMHDGFLSVADEVSVPGRARSHWHFAPGLEPSAIGGDGSSFSVEPAGVVIAFGGDAVVRSGSSTWHPEFGRIVSNHSIVAAMRGHSASTRISWT